MQYARTDRTGVKPIPFAYVISSPGSAPTHGPIKFALNARQTARQCNSNFIGRDAIAARIDLAVKTPTTIAHQVDRGGRPCPDTFEVRFAKVRDYKPAARVDQHEDGVERRYELSRRCLQ